MRHGPLPGSRDCPAAGNQRDERPERLAPTTERSRAPGRGGRTGSAPAARRRRRGPRGTALSRDLGAYIWCARVSGCLSARPRPPPPSHPPPSARGPAAMPPKFDPNEIKVGTCRAGSGGVTGPGRTGADACSFLCPQCTCAAPAGRSAPPPLWPPRSALSVWYVPRGRARERPGGRREASWGRGGGRRRFPGFGCGMGPAGGSAGRSGAGRPPRPPSARLEEGRLWRRCTGGARGLSAPRRGMVLVTRTLLAALVPQEGG